MDPVIEFWFPLFIALIGVGGTVAVTWVQLRARRVELNDERKARAEADLESRREAIIEAVYDSVAPLTAAAAVPRRLRKDVPADVALATSRVVRVIRLSRRPDVVDLHEWWAIRAGDWARTDDPNDLPQIEQSMLAEIGAWFDGTASAAEIRAQAERGI